VLPVSTFAAVRMKIARFIPEYAAVNSGLISKDESCAIPGMFKNIDFNSFRPDGSFNTRYVGRNSLSLHPPYPQPEYSPAELAAHVQNAKAMVQKLVAYGNKHGFKVIFMYPPRYETPLNSKLDEVANQVFETSENVLVLDFRAASMDKTLYHDDTHIAAPFMAPFFKCLDKLILLDIDKIVFQPVAEARGRTACKL
jgi:hypothetical protein